jgi:hypothetical protein
MTMPTSTYFDSTGAQKSAAVHQDAASNAIPIVSLDSSKATYRAAAVFTPYATGALQLFQIVGSATKTVRVKRVGVAPTTTTAAASISGYLLRASTAGASGTAVTPTIAKMDSGNTVAATAVVTHYTTAAQTVGTAVGVLSQFVVGVPIVSVPTVTIPCGMQMIFPEYGSAIGAAIVLRGTSDFLQVVNTTPANFANAVSLSYFIEWEEDAS